MKKLAALLVLFMLTLPTHVVAASINHTSGSHHQEFKLFENTSGPLPAFTLSYESISWDTRTIARGWTHSFDTILTDKNVLKGNLLQIDLFEQHFIFHPKDGKYLPAEWDHSTLDVDKNGAYIIKRDGLTYSFDKDKQLTAIIDRSGEKTTFIFANGKMVKITLPEKKTITLEYGDGGRLARITDPAGKTYTISYDDGGFPGAIGFPDESVWLFKNNSEGYMLTKTDRQGKAVTYTYDDKNRVITAMNSKGEIITINYTDGNVREKTTQINRNGEIHDMTYDAYEGTLTKKVDPTGGVSIYTYDKNGKKTSEANPAGQTTYYTYDEQGQMTSIRDPDGNVTNYKYDEHGNQVGVSDSVHGTVRHEYDAKRRITKTTGPDGKAFTYIYDAQGNLADVKGSDGSSISEVLPKCTEVNKEFMEKQMKTCGPPTNNNGKCSEAIKVEYELKVRAACGGMQ